MSSPFFCADAAPQRPILFSRQPLVEQLCASPKLARVTAASRLEVRATPELVSSGIVELDALTGGLPRGSLTEICGAASSGRTSILLATLAAGTRRQEACALVDVSDAFDPLSAAAAGVNFEKMLWVRCASRDEKNSPQRHRGAEKTLKKAWEADRSSSRNGAFAPEGPLERALRATDLLLQSGGFGLIVLDLGDIAFKFARRIPLTTWFRYQRAVETTPTVFFVIAETPLAQTCASLLVKLSAVSSQLSESPGPSHAQLLEGIHVDGELLRSRRERKPAQSVTTAFTTTSFNLTAEG